MITSLLNGETGCYTEDVNKTNLRAILEDADVCREVTDEILKSITNEGGEEEKK